MTLAGTFGGKMIKICTKYWHVCPTNSLNRKPVLKHRNSCPCLTLNPAQHTLGHETVSISRALSLCIALNSCQFTVRRMSAFLTVCGDEMSISKWFTDLSNATDCTFWMLKWKWAVSFWFEIWWEFFKSAKILNL